MRDRTGGTGFACAGLPADEYRARVARYGHALNRWQDVFVPDPVHVNRRLTANLMPGFGHERTAHAIRIVRPFRPDKRLAIGRVDPVPIGQQLVPVHPGPIFPVPVALARR